MDEKPKKVFDVSPPKTPEPTIAELAARPRKMIADPPAKDEPATLIEPAPTAEEVISHKSADIVVPSELPVNSAPEVPVKKEKLPEALLEAAPEALEPEEELPTLVDEKVTTSAPDNTKEADNVIEEEKPTEAPKTEDKQILVAEPFGAVDGLPDTSEKASAEATEAMQSPKIFDTKAYYVPIGNTKHTHGHVKGSIVAGIVTAVVAVGLLVALLQLK